MTEVVSITNLKKVFQNGVLAVNNISLKIKGFGRWF